MDILAGVVFALPVAAMVVFAALGRQYLREMRTELNYARSYIDDMRDDIASLLDQQREAGKDTMDALLSRRATSVADSPTAGW